MADVLIVTNDYLEVISTGLSFVFVEAKIELTLFTKEDCSAFCVQHNKQN